MCSIKKLTETSTPSKTGVCILLGALRLMIFFRNLPHKRTQCILSPTNTTLTKDLALYPKLLSFPSLEPIILTQSALPKLLNWDRIITAPAHMQGLISQ